MLVLDVFGPGPGLPDASPFVTKALTLLKMSGLAFETKRGDPRKAPKAKLPVLHDNGRTIADSSFIRWHLEREHGIDFDPGLKPEQKAVGFAVAKMLEESTYWIGVHDRWMIDANFDKGPRKFFNIAPAPIRPLVIRAVRGRVRKSLYAQGTGRHTQDELATIGKASLHAVADILGDKPYLLGPEPTGADATVYAIVSNVFSPVLDTPLKDAGEERPALVDYCARMQERFFPDL